MKTKPEAAPSLQAPGAYTIEEWCKHRNVHRSTLYTWSEDVKPLITRIGGLLRITREADEEWGLRMLERARQQRNAS